MKGTLALLLDQAEAVYAKTRKAQQSTVDVSKLVA